MGEQKDITEESELLSLSELCRELSISVATGQNWIRLGKLTPDVWQKKNSFFKWEYVKELKQKIQNGSNTTLKSRRNKKYISGNSLYQSYLSENSVNLSAIQSILMILEENQIEQKEELSCALLAECALQLLWNQTTGTKLTQCLKKFLAGSLPENEYFFLVEDLLFQVPFLSGILELYPALFKISYTYEEGEDILGLLYLSLKNLGNRKATGTYYTPNTVVKSLCSHLFQNMEKKEILDPCCGTGNFLLQLPSWIAPEQVYGMDIDPISIQIARINYALKYHTFDKDLIESHLKEGDYFSINTRKKYDVILGNPPWGYEFSESEKQKLKSRYQTAQGKGIESYDIFVEQALADLKPNGVLSFVLPEAFLNVKTHTMVRKLLIERCSFSYLEFLGNVFDKVQCPCIILQAQLTGKPFCSIGMIVKDGEREYKIQSSRAVSPECFSFSTTDEEYAILEKLEHLSDKVTLAGKAKFALGIVTGNNKAYLSEKKTTGNEMVLRGSDLYKFRFQPSSSYMVWQPASFQQVAPEEFYRAKEKLLYRFICNQMVFAYDDSQILSLNSGNIVIPEIEQLSMKYIMAVLNARPAQFYFKKQFRSVKVLRSHIEKIPIPNAKKEEQDSILILVDTILTASDRDKIQTCYEMIDSKIAELYQLSLEEYDRIKASLKGENLFLYSPNKRES